MATEPYHKIITDLYNYQIHFELDVEGIDYNTEEINPLHFNKVWGQIKTKCENGIETNSSISENLIKYFKLETNKKLLVLDKAEGGLCCGNQANTEGKQFKFRYDPYTYCGKPVHRQFIDSKIVLTDFTNSKNNNNNEYWTYEELNDIMNAFKLYMKDVFECEFDYIEARIVLEDKYYIDDLD